MSLNESGIGYRAFFRTAAGGVEAGSDKREDEGQQGSETQVRGEKAAEPVEKQEVGKGSC